MADTKISALPSASTPLTGTEVLPIVQGAGNFKVSVADLTAGRAVSALSYTSTTGASFATSSGNVGIGTASPAVELEVSSATGSATPAPTEIRISTTTSAADWSTTLPWGRLSFYSADGSDAGPKIQGTVDMIADAAVGGRSSMVFSSSVATTGTLTERMRITAAGNVGIGTAAPTAKLDVVGTAAISGAVTLSGGTANAVAFLNGSKVLTTGTALTFDGTTLGVSSGGSTPALKLYGASTGQGQLQFGAISGYVIQGGPDYTGLVYNVGSASYQHIFQINGSEQMRLTSTGLGIGTTSPSSPLHISRDSETQLIINRATTTTGASFARFSNGGGNYYIGPDSSTGGRGFITGGAPYGLVISAESAYPITFGTANIERMRLDSAGNLGLGVTPSGWGSNYKVLQGQAGGYALSNDGTQNNQMRLSSNAYNNGTNWIYYGTSLATSYEQRVGEHRWYNAPSGTAGNAITFTQAMTLDASGNLGIGYTLPGAKLDVRTSLSATSGVQNIADFYPTTSGATDATYGGRITLYTKNPNNNYWPAAIAAINDNGGSNLSSLGFYTASAGPTLNERMRLDSSGNLGIGTTSPSASAILDAQSTTKGVRMPNMTTTQKNAIASPAAGLMVFDTTLAKLCVYSGSAWQTITSI